MNTNAEALKKTFLELTELKHILKQTQQFFDEVITSYTVRHLFSRCLLNEYGLCSHRYDYGEDAAAAAQGICLDVVEVHTERRLSTSLLTFALLYLITIIWNPLTTPSHSLFLLRGLWCATEGQCAWMGTFTLIRGFQLTQVIWVVKSCSFDCHHPFFLNNLFGWNILLVRLQHLLVLCLRAVSPKFLFLY